MVSDETDRRLTADRLREMRPELVISCGDLPADYLDFVSSAANALLLYVPGNHDPELRTERARRDWTPSPPPGMSLDGRVRTEHGLRIAGLGGSIRYRPGPNQYTQREARQRVRSLVRRERVRGLGRVRPLDLFVAHAPPLGVGDESDAAHRGFEAYHDLIARFRPRIMVHGHIHPYGLVQPDRRIGQTEIVNVIPYRLIELP